MLRSRHDEQNSMSIPPTPVLFIHGLWLHASSWRGWTQLFDEAGYAASAPGWPGEPNTVAAARANPEAVADLGVDDLMRHFTEIIGRLPALPIIVGHSFGGLLAEKLLGEGYGRAAVAIDPAQMKGVLPLPLAQLRSALPVLGNPLNLHKAVALTKSQFRFGFGNALPEAESDELFEKWAIPSPAKPLFEAAFANFHLHAPTEVNTGNESRGPLLLISGLADHTVPDVTTQASFRRYRESPATTELKRFEGRGHSLTIDHGWRELAQEILAWLRARAL
jgi:pimeloyl-ACP methyl ester carboxylesterase